MTTILWLCITVAALLAGILIGEWDRRSGADGPMTALLDPYRQHAISVDEHAEAAIDVCHPDYHDMGVHEPERGQR